MMNATSTGSPLQPGNNRLSETGRYSQNNSHDDVMILFFCDGQFQACSDQLTPLLTVENLAVEVLVVSD